MAKSYPYRGFEIELPDPIKEKLVAIDEIVDHIEARKGKLVVPIKFQFPGNGTQTAINFYNKLTRAGRRFVDLVVNEQKTDKGEISRILIREKLLTSQNGLGTVVRSVLGHAKRMGFVFEIEDLADVSNGKREMYLVSSDTKKHFGV